MALEGFWDPCPGFDKALLVRYVFLGHAHEVVVPEEDALKCPLKRAWG